jgi:hypothetical protein
MKHVLMWMAVAKHGSSGVAVTSGSAEFDDKEAAIKAGEAAQVGFNTAVDRYRFVVMPKWTAITGKLS